MIYRFLIVGGPGFGKTTLVNTLRDMGNGYLTKEEAARKTINKNLVQKSDSLPKSDRDKFDSELYTVMVDDFMECHENEIVFFDGGLTDILAWRSYLKRDNSKYEHILDMYKYAPIVFNPVSWPEIYYSNEVRPFTFAEASDINLHIKQFYTQIGYTVVELPKYTPIQRANIVIESINSKFPGISNM